MSQESDIQDEIALLNFEIKELEEELKKEQEKYNKLIGDKVKRMLKNRRKK